MIGSRALTSVTRMPALTRGSLPARVYWVRRLMVLGTALLLVFAIGRLLDGGSDGASSGGDGPAARLAADKPTAASSTPPTSATASPSATVTEVPVLADPVGDCAASDLVVTPTVQQAVAGRDVQVVLVVRTLEAEACNWQVTPDTLTVDITSGRDHIWASRECRRAVPHRNVVVRKAVTTDVPLVWKEARRSDESCSARAGWAMPGWYHVTAAALGGEPADLQFELTTPTAATVTRTATPKQQPTQKPTKKSSGAVEPD